MKIKSISLKLLEIISSAGEIILSAHSKNGALNIDEKSGTSNFVTQFDVSVQNFLIEKIKELIPEAYFIAEEKENDSNALLKDFCVIIDPIDGTANFINNYHHSCISVAIVSKGETVFGAVYDPYLKEMFHAIRGCGAFLNGEKISLVNRPIERAMVAFGSSPYHKDSLTEKTFELVKELFLVANDIRRAGSAALDLAYLAAGRNDIFVEMILQPWDSAAGVLLVEEAGGIVTNMKGEKMSLSSPSSILGASKNLHSTILKIASKYA